MFRKKHYIPKQIAKSSDIRVMKANKLFFVVLDHFGGRGKSITLSYSRMS